MARLGRGRPFAPHVKAPPVVGTSGAVTGAASLASVATLAGAGRVDEFAASAFASVATLAGAGRVDQVGAAALASVATLAGAGRVDQHGASALASVATLTGAGQLGTALSGAANLAAVATLAGAGRVDQLGATALASVATLAAAGTVSLHGAAAFAAVATLAGAGHVPVVTPPAPACPPLPLLALVLRRRGHVVPPPSPVGYLEEAIVARVKASAPLTAVIGPRIYPVILPQTKPLSSPAISFETGDDEEESGLSGESGIVRASVTFECRSPRQAQSVQLRELLRNNLGGFHGRVANVIIHFVRSDGRSTDYDEPADSSDLGTHVSTCQFRFTYRITPPRF